MVKDDVRGASVPGAESYNKAIICRGKRDKSSHYDRHQEMKGIIVIAKARCFYRYIMPAN